MSSEVPEGEIYIENLSRLHKRNFFQSQIQMFNFRVQCRVKIC